MRNFVTLFSIICLSVYANASRLNFSQDQVKAIAKEAVSKLMLNYHLGAGLPESSEAIKITKTFPMKMGERIVDGYDGYSIEFPIRLPGTHEYHLEYMTCNLEITEGSRFVPPLASGKYSYDLEDCRIEFLKSKDGKGFYRYFSILNGSPIFTESP